MKLMILGATGAVGQQVLDQAVASGRYSLIVAPTRKPLKHDMLTASVLNPVTDMSLPLPDADWWAVDAVICCLGTTLRQAGSQNGFYAVDHDLVVACANKAQAAGAHRFALNSSLGANATSRSFYLKTKGETEQHLQELSFSRLVLVRPSLIDAERTETRLGEHAGLIASRLFKPLIPKRYQPVPAGKIAAALLGSLSGPDGCDIIESEKIQSL
ncbi:NAD(P)H-binding protein [Marinobacter sp. 1Y8]